MQDYTATHNGKNVRKTFSRPHLAPNKGASSQNLIKQIDTKQNKLEAQKIITSAPMFISSSPEASTAVGAWGLLDINDEEQIEGAVGG